jgi:hypothetical protein
MKLAALDISKKEIDESLAGRRFGSSNGFKKFGPG